MKLTFFSESRSFYSSVGGIDTFAIAYKLEGVSISKFRQAGFGTRLHSSGVDSTFP